MIRYDDLRYKIWTDTLEIENTLLKLLQENKQMKIKNDAYKKKSSQTLVNKLETKKAKQNVVIKEDSINNSISEIELKEAAMKKSLQTISQIKYLIQKMPLIK